MYWHSHVMINFQIRNIWGGGCWFDKNSPLLESWYHVNFPGMIDDYKSHVRPGDRVI